MVNECEGASNPSTERGKAKFERSSNRETREVKDITDILDKEIKLKF